MVKFRVCSGHVFCQENNILWMSKIQISFLFSDQRAESASAPEPGEPRHPGQDEPCDCQRGQQDEGHRAGQHHEEGQGLPREHSSLPGPEPGSPW